MFRTPCIYICYLVILITSGSAEVRVAVLDSGCNIEYDEGISFVDGTVADISGHGTAVAKLIKEVNPSAKLYIAKVFNRNGWNSDSLPIVNGLRWAISQQVDIINLSWQTHRDDKAIHDAIRDAYNQGIIIVAAAGNTDEFLGSLVHELSKQVRDQQVVSIGVKYPAKYDEVIAVGAITSFLGIVRHERYSPVGEQIEFVCDGTYGSQKGTSFAAARATGIISKVKEQNFQLKANQLRETLRRYARDLGEKGRDMKFGYGKLEYVPSK